MPRPACLQPCRPASRAFPSRRGSCLPKGSAACRYAAPVPDLVLLRHGQSTWNASNQFTGWVDVDLTVRGAEEALQAGQLLKDERANGLDLRVVHTSVLTRAIRTAELALGVCERSWLPVRRHWRLNERHYGALQGLDKKETAERHGKEQLMAWRRGYATPPPPLPEADRLAQAADPRYRDVPDYLLPASECLADVVRRTLPYWDDVVVPDLFEQGARGGAVLVAAHGNSLRAIRKHLEHISDEDIVDLEIPTGIPYRFRLADNLSVLESGPLGDPDAAAAAAEEVRRQAG
jgi:2,3-bisphosphoglycerate-dependent phosphoglycerate mutase